MRATVAAGVRPGEGEAVGLVLEDARDLLGDGLLDAVRRVGCQWRPIAALLAVRSDADVRRRYEVIQLTSLNGRGPAAGAARVAGQRRRRAGPCPPVHRAERGLLKKGRATSTSITAALGVPAGGSPRSLRLAAPKAVAATGGVDASNSAA